MIEKDVKTITFAVRDAWDPSIWSRTPANVAKAMQDLGWEIRSASNEFDSRLVKARHLISYQLQKIRIASFANPIEFVRALSRDGRVHYQRIASYRRAAAREFERNLARTAPGPVLHFGTAHMPLTSRSEAWRHFLLLDSTWALSEPYMLAASALNPRHLAEARELERSSYARIEHFFPIGEHVADSLVMDYGVSRDRITPVGTGRGGILTYDGPKDYSQGQILFCAKVRCEEKGVDLILEGFSHARKRLPWLKLVLVGHESYPERAESRDGVTGHGSVSWEELQQLFRDSALFAMPAIHEPWGLVYLEALVSRMPLLGLNRLSLPELTGHGRFGFLVNQPDPTQIGDALVAAFSDLDALEQMGRDGQQFCLDHYDWSKVADRIGNVAEAG